MIGNNHVGAAHGNCGSHRVDGTRDGGHRAGHGRSIAHQFTAPTRDLDQTGRVKDARFMQCGNLAEAMAGNAGRPYADGMQHVRQRLAVHTKRGLCPLGGRQFFLLRFTLCVGEHRLRKHHIVQALAVKRKIGRIVPGLPRLVERHRHLGAHTHVLAALTGKQESELADICRAGCIVHPQRAGVCRVWCLFNGGGRLRQLFSQFATIRGDDREAYPVASRKRKLCLAGNVAKFFLAARQCAALGNQLSRAVGAEQYQLGGNRAQTPGRFAGIHRRHVFLKCDVEVTAAKAETRHGGAAWMCTVANPRTAFSVQVERALFDFQFWVRAVDLDRWR